jgi:hypothetical protein
MSLDDAAVTSAPVAAAARSFDDKRAESLRLLELYGKTLPEYLVDCVPVPARLSRRGLEVAAVTVTDSSRGRSTSGGPRSRAWSVTTTLATRRSACVVLKVSQA